LSNGTFGVFGKTDADFLSKTINVSGWRRGNQKNGKHDAQKNFAGTMEGV